MRNSPARGGVAKRPAAHPCSMCAKRFTKRSNLRIHERLHTGERPYVCRFHGCGRSYKWLSSINFHEGRCERRAFGLASASVNANNTTNASTPNSQALPSSPVTPVRAFSNELVLPPATHLKRIAEAPTTTNPRRRHAPMPVSLPPPLPPTSAPILAPTPSHPNHHPHHYQQQQQPPSVLMQMARALPPAPLPLTQFGTQYAHHPLAAPSFGMPTHHSAQLQRLLGGVAPPVPIAAPHVSSGVVVDNHNQQQQQQPQQHHQQQTKQEEEYVHAPTSAPQPTTSREMYHDSNATTGPPTTNDRSRQEEANGNTQQTPQQNGTNGPVTGPGGRVQCTVAGGVLDDLTTGGYGFDSEQAHSEVLLF